MSNRTLIGVTVALLMLLASPLSVADDKDYDKADRVYEKYKEREQNQSKEKRVRRSSRSSGSEQDRKPKSEPDRRASSNRDSRADNSRDRRSENTTKSRERSTERRVYERSSSSNNNRDSGYRSSARDEGSSPQTGEQLSRGVRDLLTRKSQRRQAPDQDSRSQNSNDRQNRSYSETSDRTVRETVSLDQAVNIVRRQTDGKVISARSEGSGATRKHRIKVLIGERRVRTYVVSATTGKVY